MKQRRRTQKRASLRQKRREAEAERAKYDLCECQDETKTYGSRQEADDDESPPLVCDQCGRDRLRVQMVRAAGARVSTGDVLKHVARG